MNTSLYNSNRPHKIIGSVQSSAALINHERMSSCVLDIKASNYDLSLRNHNLLGKYSSIYNISNSISDYLFIPVPIFITFIPNKNGIGFTSENIHMFYEDIGLEAYQTWIGKPCHVEHRDEDKTKAVGMIFDSVMRPLPGFSIPLEQCWVLWGLDRTKDVDLTNTIQTATHNYFSMGAKATNFQCSACGMLFKKKDTNVNGRIIKQLKPACNCLAKWPRMLEVNGQVACANAMNIVGDEVSYVRDPAWVSAEATKILETR